MPPIHVHYNFCFFLGLFLWYGHSLGKLICLFSLFSHILVPKICIAAWRMRFAVAHSTWLVCDLDLSPFFQKHCCKQHLNTQNFLLLVWLLARQLILSFLPQYYCHLLTKFALLLFLGFLGFLFPIVKYSLKFGHRLHNRYKFLTHSFWFICFLNLISLIIETSKINCLKIFRNSNNYRIYFYSRIFLTIY